MIEDDKLQLTPRTTMYGAGIYAAGDTNKCYTKLFVTDTGFVLPVNHRSINEEDLLDVYERGRLDGQVEALFGEPEYVKQLRQMHADRGGDA